MEHPDYGGSKHLRNVDQFLLTTRNNIQKTAILISNLSLPSSKDQNSNVHYNGYRDPVVARGLNPTCQSG
jgi:hypothetical protein